MGNSYKQDTKLAFIVKVKDDRTKLSSRSQRSVYIQFDKGPAKNTHIQMIQIYISTNSR